MSTGTASAAVAADTATAHDAEPTTPTTTPSIGDPAAAAAAAAALEFMGDLDEAAILALLGRRASLRHVKIKGMPPLLYFCAMFDEEMALRVLVGPLAGTAPATAAVAQRNHPGFSSRRPPPPVRASLATLSAGPGRCAG